MRVTKHATLRMGPFIVPVGVCTAASRKDITFNGLHVDCGGRIGIKGYCKSCGETELDGKTVKGYEVSKNEFVVFTEAELEAFKPARASMIDITKFVQRDEIEPVMVDKTYWLQPNEALHAPYELLAAGLMQTGTAAVGRTTLWGKEHPFAIDVDAGVLSMKLLFCFDELASPAEIRTTLAFDMDQEYLDVMKQVIEKKSDTITTEDLTDVSREEAYKLIAAKAAGEELVAPAPTQDEPAPVNLMASLKAILA